jgi:hypothetical protein
MEKKKLSPPTLLVVLPCKIFRCEFGFFEQAFFFINMGGGMRESVLKQMEFVSGSTRRFCRILSGNLPKENLHGYRNSPNRAGRMGVTTNVNCAAEEPCWKH